MKEKGIENPEEESKKAGISEKKAIELRDPLENYRRPYGLLAKAGISTTGMSPREAWSAVDELRRAEAAARRQEKEAAKRPNQAKNKPARAGNKPKAKEPQKVLNAPKPEHSQPKAEQKAKVPELSERDRETANGNSMFNRGNVTVNSYRAYADEINGWDIGLNQKEKLIAQLKKKFDEKLSLDARYVPWTVSGPARYPAQKMKGLAMRGLKKSAEISDWFDGVRKSVKNSRSQYKDDKKAKARRREEWFNRAMSAGCYNSGGQLNSTAVARGLEPIAQYDPKRFAELYEKYDKELRFRKNTNAAKLYEKVKSGEYKGVKPPEKLYESDGYNAYRKTIQSGERVFMKFTIKPKPQLIYALKKRGWHWNGIEQAWSVPTEKYDADFVKGIEERYKKYL